MLEILYQDEYIIAINKPSGLLVHKSFYAMQKFIQELRNQIGGHVYPVHRLDRKTSGVLLFALTRKF
jgi:tRNA pseudouridine65 synthase